jgi:hypothetical protein
MCARKGEWPLVKHNETLCFRKTNGVAMSRRRSRSRAKQPCASRRHRHVRLSRQGCMTCHLASYIRGSHHMPLAVRSREKVNEG